jgi:hypothetical protein
MADLSAHPGTPLPSREVGEVARALLAVIASGGSHTLSSLAARLNASPALVDLALQVLIVGGRIEEVVSPEDCVHATDETIEACGTCGLAASCVSKASPTAAGLCRLRLVPRGR